MLNPNIPGPVRVSILERLVPSFAFIVAAISGAVGAVMLFIFLRAMREAETAGYAAFFGGIAEIELVVGAVLVFAAALGAIGIFISIIRLFTTNTTASPPGILFLIVGLLSLVPSLALRYILQLIKGIVSSPTPTDGGISTVAGTITAVSYFAIGSAGLIALVMIAFSFIPFSSRPGRKASTLVCLMLVEILIAAMIGLYFWEARTSFAERDRERPSAEPSYDTPDANSYESNFNRAANEPGNTFDSSSNTHANLRGKTISGGVLNGKATNLPKPVYPPAARAVNATGSVTVQVLVDEKGEVVSANAVSGHPLLRAAAVQAARQARFAPTKLSGQPVKVSGVLTFNFSVQ